MAINLEIRKLLKDDSVVFDNPSFDNSIIGITLDGRTIYDFNKMIQELMTDENWSDEEAIEWIEYNTLRTIPYIDGLSPIIITNIMET